MAGNVHHETHVATTHQPARAVSSNQRTVSKAARPFVRRMIRNISSRDTGLWYHSAPAKPRSTALALSGPVRS